VSALVGELANTSRSGDSRQQAGLQLKNALTSNVADVASRKAAMWRTIEPALRTHVKQTVRSSWRRPCRCSCRFVLHWDAAVNRLG
jgi:hypothetical protein